MATKDKRTQFKNTNKKKNTYIINVPAYEFYALFMNKEFTPLPVKIINGVSVNENSAFYETKPFPNPGAFQMVLGYRELAAINHNAASTITEYLDKETNKPVLYMFPTGFYVNAEYKTNYMSRLNHASRRDLKYRIAMYNELLRTAINNRGQSK